MQPAASLGLGEQIRVYRRRRRLSQAELAEQAGVSVNTVRRIEAGKLGRLETAVRIYEALGIPLDLRIVEEATDVAREG